MTKETGMILLLDEQYENYVNLLTRRDQLMREADAIEAQYYQIFGDLIIKSFKRKIECIRYKKMISYCQAKVNSGQKVNQGELKEYITTELALYEEQLKEMQLLTKSTFKSVSGGDTMKVKRLYREIAKMIHPDMQPELYKNLEIREIWRSAVIAYRAADANELESLKVQAAAAIRRITGDSSIPMLKIKNLDQKIKMLKSQIDYIVNSEPYTYEKIIRKPNLVEERKKELTNEIDIYDKYLTELKGVYATYKLGDKNEK